jgi:hypothetical protein
MKLTRRDVLLGGAAGLAGGTALQAGFESASAESDAPAVGLTSEEIATLVSLATVLYPSSISVEPGFLSGYYERFDADRTGAVSRAVAELDAGARTVYGDRFGALSERRRKTVLHELGVDTANPDPDGTVPARLRYYLVNGLMYALFTSPRGSRFFGVQNPIGYPGGYYRPGGKE